MVENNFKMKGFFFCNHLHVIYSGNTMQHQLHMDDDVSIYPIW